MTRRQLHWRLPASASSLHRAFRMKVVSQVRLMLIALLAVYACSYVILRSTIMQFGANRQLVHGEVKIKTWVYFGGGDNLATRVASVAYFPMHRIEHACSRRVVYE